MTGELRSGGRRKGPNRASASDFMPPPGVTFDSREIYLTAKAYEAAAAILSERLHAPLSKQMFRLLAIPAWYNLAFALELYLKCLHTLSSKCNPPEEHDFDVLWRNVPKDLRNRVKKAFKHSCESRIVNRSRSMVYF